METSESDRWHRNSATGEWIMPALQKQYLDEQLVAMPPSLTTDKDWAAAHDVSDRALRRWKADPKFREAWEKAADDQHMGPEFVAPLIQNLHRIASDPEHPKAVQAAETLLKYTERMKPPVQRIVVERGQEFEVMSDEELASFLMNAESDHG